ncbi:GNAT family N-acetyltransferase [Chelatococcus reniformis]|uniref:Ribosomal-protein-alanine N-acetyltransferase n=1 Tax=Chelatococcus reniformis TaxID=1494448 RepID=A0A916XC90_9HYPH|nr:GNAT family protein [Chelatococcus reniformis]GGC62917.1 ribosomal-protein-alanine N-acetyltransferase [Chelatococcus reniformis]
MALFRLTSANESFPRVHGSGLYLRAPTMNDYEEWAVLRAESRAFLEPWEPLWPADDLTRTAFRRRIRRYIDEIRNDCAYPLLVFASPGDLLVGGLTLGLIRRGVSQSATVGYWMGERYAGRGLMTEAVKATSRFAFGELGLRRLEAACLPTNGPSIRLLEKAGYIREGLARRYLCIAGEWQDHLLYARLRDDPNA